MPDAGTGIDTEVAVDTQTPTTLSNRDKAVVQTFSAVRREGSIIKGLPSEFTLNDITYRRINENPDRTLDVRTIDLTSPDTRLAFLYGKDVPGSPFFVPDSVHLIGEIVPGSPDLPTAVIHRLSTELDIRPNVSESERVINDGAHVRLYGFTRGGESAHTTTTAEVGGNVVYEMQTQPGADFQLARSRLLAMWHGSAAMR